MLNQLIYTRCFPHRDLKNQGQVIRSGGFGIFSMSQELFQDGETANPELLQRVLAVRSGSREASDAGIFTVYEYNSLSENTFALSREDTRSRLTDESSGQRTGGFIKQCYTGAFKGRPCEWFGSDEWGAWRKPEEDYYLDRNSDEEPGWLPQGENEPIGGYISLDGVKAFVRDGRTEAVKAALWFLLNEYEKPEEERRVLLIRDTPENVELWVAAIEYALPASMAGTVTFVTNRTNLSAQINSELYYYVDNNGRFSPVGNSGGALKRRPYCMIVGFHPLDEFCGSLALTSTDRYGMLDGIEKTACFQPMEAIDGPYYAAAVQYGKKIKEFYEEVLPCLRISQICTSLPRAYNAWEYLFYGDISFEDRMYYAFCSCVQALREAGLAADREASLIARELSGRLLEECIHVYPRFVEEDEDGGYVLLTLMWQMAQELGCPDRVSACLAQRLSRECENLSMEGVRLGKTWEALKRSSLTELVMPTLAELFGDDRIPLYLPLIETAPPATAAIVLDMLFTMAEATPHGIRMIGDSDEKYNFVCLALTALQKDREELEKALARLQASPELFYALVASGVWYLEKEDAKEKSKGVLPNRVSDWWEAVFTLYGGDIGKLCRTLYQQRDQMSEDVEEVFFRKIDTLLNPWHRSDTRAGIRSALPVAEHRADGRSILPGLGSQTGPVTPETYFEMKKWASACGRVSVSVSFYEFRENMRRARSADEALSLAEAFAGGNFKIDHLYIGSEYFRTVATAAAQFCNENLHFVMACLFQMPDTRMLTTYIETYVSEALLASKGHRLAEEIVSLTGAVVYLLDAPGRSSEYMQDAQYILEQALRKYLPQYYTPKLAGKILSREDCTGELKEKLMALLEAARRNYRPSVPERIAGKVRAWRKPGN